MSAKKVHAKAQEEKVKRLIFANAVLRAEIAELKKELEDTNAVFFKLIKIRQKWVDQWLDQNEKLEKIAENPKWDITLRDFLKAALAGKLD